MHDFFLRLPEPLWEALNQSADADQRSATQQAIWILKQHLEAAPPPSPPAKKKKPKKK
jgi:hypothetical protein